MTFPEAKWGLLLIAEEGFGKRLRELQAQEDEQMQRARSALGG
jgi:hypothetical protein